MRRDTKLAIIVAVVCIGLGTWYVFRDKFSSGKAKSEAPSTAAKQPAPDRPPRQPLPATWATPVRALRCIGP